MNADVFEVVNELKKFFEENSSLSILGDLIKYKNLDVSMEYSKGAIAIKSKHPLVIPIHSIYNILLRLHIVRSVALAVDFMYDQQRKSVSKQFGAEEDIKPIIDDLLSLPHDQLMDIIIETDTFKLVKTEDSYDNISIILKQGGKEMFKSLGNYLFPFVNMASEQSLRQEISFAMNGDELTVDVNLAVDGVNLGIKSKRVKLV
jgi:hypothetical protein